MAFVLTFACGGVVSLAIYETLVPREVTLDLGLPKASRATSVNYDGLNSYLEAWLIVNSLYVEKPEPKKMVRGSIKGMIKSLGDKHSVYLPPEEYTMMREDMDGSFCGIGTVVRQTKNGEHAVVQVLPGGAADKAKLASGDIIQKVNGKSIKGMALREAVRLIRGKEGTPVKLTIKRTGWPEAKTFTLIRAKVEIPNLEYKLIKHQGKRLAYVRLNGFTGVSVSKMIRAIDQFQRQKAQGLILDLRYNPGGLLYVALQLGSAWIGKDTVTWVVGRDGLPHPMKGRETARLTGRLRGFPTVVLLNGHSASASELLSGCLQDHGQAVIIGEKSYGKGSVQTMRPLSDGGLIKLTVQHFLSPKHKKIDHVGIKPNQEVKLTPEDVKAKRDPQLDAAKSFLAGTRPNRAR